MKRLPSRSRLLRALCSPPSAPSLPPHATAPRQPAARRHRRRQPAAGSSSGSRGARPDHRPRWLVHEALPDRPAAGGRPGEGASAARRVGQRERIVVVEVGDQWIVLGVAPAASTRCTRMPRGRLHVRAPALARSCADGCAAGIFAHGSSETIGRSVKPRLTQASSICAAGAGSCAVVAAAAALLRSTAAPACPLFTSTPTRRRRPDLFAAACRRCCC